jgi:hypothetical protein
MFSIRNFNKLFLLVIPCSFRFVNCVSIAAIQNCIMVSIYQWINPLAGNYRGFGWCLIPNYQYCTMGYDSPSVVLLCDINDRSFSNLSKKKKIHSLIIYRLIIKFYSSNVWKPIIEVMECLRLFWENDSSEAENISKQ